MSRLTVLPEDSAPPLRGFFRRSEIHRQYGTGAANSHQGERAGSDAGMGCPMPSHKFHVGESVTVLPAISRNVPGGVYEVTKQLPHNGREFEYRIKSASEEHERVVRESEWRRCSICRSEGSGYRQRGRRTRLARCSTARGAGMGVTASMLTGSGSESLIC